ncbi:MAG: HD domain-containing protein [Pirellulaceae bacterium]|jgi:predicted HD phosphohydrolase
MHPAIEFIVQCFETKGDGVYGDEQVTQRQHALQSAKLAVDHHACDSLVAAALLHDLGHILADDPMPDSRQKNLDDRHEYRAYDWLVEAFGKAVAEPIGNHVLAKRYLCTTEAGYLEKLSPTSHKSYLDQGGPLPPAACRQFEASEFFEDSVRLRRWDDLAKDPHLQTPTLESYIPLLERLLAKSTESCNSTAP